MRLQNNANKSSFLGVGQIQLTSIGILFHFEHAVRNTSFVGTLLHDDFSCDFGAFTDLHVFSGCTFIDDVCDWQNIPRWNSLVF